MSSPGVAAMDDGVDGGGERISGQGAPDAAVKAAAAAAYMLTSSPAWQSAAAAGGNGAKKGDGGGMDNDVGGPPTAADNSDGGLASCSKLYGEPSCIERRIIFYKCINL